MPFLDASALETDPDGAAFLLAVLRWRPDATQGTVGGRLSPLLGPHSIRFDRGLRASGRARKPISRENVGRPLSRQAAFRLAPPSPYHVTIKPGSRA
ncbi:MAG: hypothetical protein ACJ8CS_05220 [Microvirga sp.]|jgi:hypothetical protein